VQLFLHAPPRVDALSRAHLGNQVTMADRAALPSALAALSGQRVRLDAEATPASLVTLLREAGAEVVAAEDPCRLPRACKNAAERQGARDAHAKDAVAVFPLPRLVRRRGPTRRLSEIAAAEQLLAFRREVPGFAMESFPRHLGRRRERRHRPLPRHPETDRPIRAGECFLLDSGGQYPEGTTDITRTLWTGPGPARRRCAPATTPPSCAATSPWPRCASPRAWPAPTSTPSPPPDLGSRAGLRPRHRPRRRLLPVRPRGPGLDLPRARASSRSAPA
jgi:Xaa-Pro aminopeptidase